ncbi:MAG TPA: serine/threonine-protein kinase [Actinomycetes bacterium]|nr:serine/threonine-protein kinase [Actinomycetes bacterium]
MQSEPDIRVSGYRIEARVGRGGMGDVYRAEQLNLGRKVALKILRPDLAADDGFRRRFLRESRIAAGIDHPNVIPVYEAGEDDGLLYIAMRYVEGMDLATMLEREGRLHPARTMAILSQVAHALDAAHARGLVHRDVKPANVLLPAAGGGSEHCYLCDFGLIKEMDAAAALTATDQFVGSVPYVAPEQIEGRAIDGRTDVYSLGCVVFHCLSGSAPYQGETDVEVVFAHLGEPPPPLSSRVAGLPPGLDWVLLRAMAKDREDRYPTCSALMEAASAQVAAGAATPRSPRPTDDDTRTMLRPPPRAGTAAAGAGVRPDAAQADAAAPPDAERAAARTDPAAPRPAPPPAAPAAGPPLAAPAAGPAPAAPAAGPPPARPAPPSPPGPPPAQPAPPPARQAAPPARQAAPPARQAAPAPPGGPPARPDPPSPRGRPDGRGGGRRWSTVLAVLLLPVVTYLVAVQVFARARTAGEPSTAGVVQGQAGGTPATCAGGWVEPRVGTADRQAPLRAIRARLGVDGRFAGVDMRMFRGPDGVRRWYVKAYQEADRSVRGRWLVEEPAAGERRVAAEAPYGTRGYRPSDWDAAEGGRPLPAAVVGCLAGT